MSALRLFAREDWQKKLMDQRCKRFEGPGRSGLETGEWWTTEHDRLFIVACDSRGFLRSDDLQQVLVEIAKLRPLDLDT